MKKVQAETTLTVDVICPHCKEWYDVLQYGDSTYFWESMPSGQLYCNWWLNYQIQCPYCLKEYIIDSVIF